MIKTLAQVAEEWQVEERWLRETIRTMHVAVLRRGRIILFDDVAINSLKEAMRCHYGSTKGKGGQGSTSRARSPGKSYENALRLTAPQPREKRPPYSKSKSSAGSISANVVALRPLAKR